MCGIVGLFLKTAKHRNELGDLLGQMLVTMGDRGPDSAGVAIYGEPVAGEVKLSIRMDEVDADPDSIVRGLSAAIGSDVKLLRTGPRLSFVVSDEASERAVTWLRSNAKGITVVGSGRRMEIVKGVGRPEKVVSAYGIESFEGSHGIGHTRMATESAVTTDGAHPFSTGLDQCLVHNGSLSNHNSLRRELTHKGISFATDNDSEVAAGYLTQCMRDGASLGEALESSLDDLDGFFTFVVATENGFGVLRDPVAWKPAVMAETDAWVAFGSEYRALTPLPGVAQARVWEPKPATVYFWETEPAS